jgi:hypothetical protein
MYDEPRRLVDYKHRAVLEHHSERHRFALHLALLRQLCADAHLLTSQDPVLAAQRPAIDLDRA